MVDMNSFVDQVTLSKKVKSDLQVHLDTSYFTDDITLVIVGLFPLDKLSMLKRMIYSLGESESK